MSERKTKSILLVFLILSLLCTSLFIIFLSETKLLLKRVNILEELC